GVCDLASFASPLLYPPNATSGLPALTLRTSGQASLSIRNYGSAVGRFSARLQCDGALPVQRACLIDPDTTCIIEFPPAAAQPISCLLQVSVPLHPCRGSSQVYRAPISFSFVPASSSPVIMYVLYGLLGLLGLACV